ncbi:DNA-protecting protein DprA [Bailinhaonella thermotolerans]|uniref:DNA-protecting protein DprA n=2 Tax=Bailinhaonella thermotolerans TaxID=1070861 RepID=A0A3A4A4E3_9ACTN|nr:DNA-protecting protein DprA [Bailinhaonella thermotolerans]
MGRLVAAHGAAGALACVRAGRWPGEFAAAERARAGRRESDLERRLESWRARLPLVDPGRDLAATERAGARVVVPGDPGWPTQLDDLGDARPLILWLRGDAEFRFACLRSVAIVGSRACTAYGAQVAADFAGTLSERGWTVVSGGAYGIDGAAHRGALSGGAPTVCVLACGVDVPYPAGHTHLFDAIRADGVLVSESPPGARPARTRFLVRNRVIAALSRGTLVVEAAIRSGALNTAAHAADLSRHVAAVPGPVTSELSAGCHRLLRESAATCVTTPEELIELIGEMGGDLAPVRRAPTLPLDTLSPEARRVLDALPARGGAGPATIAIAAGLPLTDALAHLGHLSAIGQARQTPQGWRRRPTPPP